MSLVSLIREAQEKENRKLLRQQGIAKHLRFVGKRMRGTQMRIILRVIERYQHPDSLFTTTDEHLNSIGAVLRIILLHQNQLTPILGRYWYWYWQHTITNYSLDKLWEEMATRKLFAWSDGFAGRCYCLTERGYEFARPWYSRLWTFVCSRLGIEVIGVLGALAGLFGWLLHHAR